MSSLYNATITSSICFISCFEVGHIEEIKELYASYVIITLLMLFHFTTVFRMFNTYTHSHALDNISMGKCKLFQAAAGMEIFLM